jgi:spermidine synthase
VKEITKTGKGCPYYIKFINKTCNKINLSFLKSSKLVTIKKLNIVRNYKIIFFCFFLSGAAGLMYEIIWARFFSLTFGSTTYSITTVLSAFMAGLAFGSLIFGRLADRIQQRLLLYGWIELFIGLYALAFPFIFRFSSSFYLHIVETGEVAHIQKLVLKFALSFLIMFIPTTLMGGSLPVLSRFFINNRASISSKLGSLYAVNTFGAVVGTYLIGFHMITIMGLNASIIVAALINIIIGTGIIFYALKTKETEIITNKKTVKPEKERPTKRERHIITFAVIAFMISGFVALSHEVVWTRILSLIIGSSTYAFTMILIGFLIGIALGSYLVSHSRLIPHEKINLTMFSLIQIGIGLSTYMLIPIFSKLPYFMLNAFKIKPDNYSFITFYQFILTLFIMLLPTTLMGATLPVIGKIVSREVRSVGTTIGNIYFFNTFGAIFGAFFAGFLLIPYLGTLSTLKLGIYINILLGTGGIIFFTYQQKKIKVLLAYLLIASIIISGVLASKWDTSLMDSGASIYGNKIAQSNEGNREFKDGSRLVYLQEGINSTVTVRKSENSFVLKTNGKADASTYHEDMTTQTSLGYLPLMLHPDPGKVLVIGLASGVTAGIIAQYDTIQFIDIAEIEPSMLEAATFFKEVNNNITEHPRANFIMNDGRNHLLETKEKYDIITSEPPNPWISGIGNLFTEDFYRLVNKRLSPGGIFCQWVQFYSISPENIKMILRTLAISFEDVQLWIGRDILVIGSNTKIQIDPARIKSVMNFNNKTRADFANYLFAENPVEIIGRLFMDKSEVLNFTQRAQINSDNHPYLEFSAPKDLYHDYRVKIYKELSDISAKKMPDILLEIKDSNDIAKIYFHRSKLYTQFMKWFAWGEYYINKALELDRTREDFYFQLGKILFLNKEYDRAREAVDRGLAINKTAKGIHLLFDILLSTEKNNEALKILQEHKYLLNDYEIRYASMLYKAEQYQEAIPYLEGALKKKQGGEYLLLYIIGNCYKFMNQLETAESYYLQSIQKEEMNQKAQLSLGELYWKQKRYEEACRIFSFLEQYWKKDYTISQRLDDCSAKLNQPEVVPR